MSQVAGAGSDTVSYGQCDEAGQATRMMLPGYRTVIFGYDPNGNLVSVTPPGQPAHVMTYTAVDQIGSYQPPGYTPADGAVTTYVYTPDRRLDKVTRPDGQDIDLIYDTAPGAGGAPPTGQLQEVQVWPGAAQATDATRLMWLELFYGDPTAPSSGERFAHLRQLTRHTVADPATDVTLTFDYEGFLPTRSEWSGAVSGSVDRSFNDRFGVSVQTVTAGHPSGTGSYASQVSYSYDLDGLVTSVGDLIVGRDAQTGLVDDTHVGQAWVSLSRNGFGELSELLATTGSSTGPTVYQEQVDEFPFGVQLLDRDHLGRIRGRHGELPSGATVEWSYQYDAALRLYKAQSSAGPDLRYSYDTNGNRTQLIDHGSGRSCTGTYEDDDRLTDYTCQTPGDPSQDVSYQYSYTLSGELSSRTVVTGPASDPGAQTTAVTTYTHDAFGNLLHVTLPDGSSVQYVVDGLGRRVGRIKLDAGDHQVDAETYSLLYQDGLRPAALLNAQGELVRRYVYATGKNVPDYFVDYGWDSQGGGGSGSVVETRYALVTDHLGSPRVVVNAETGALVEKRLHGPFGQVDSSGPGSGQSSGNWVDPAAVAAGYRPVIFGFAGGLIDPDTGLVHFGARDYDPVVGRWTSKDPIRFAGGSTNLYGYVVGDPINLLDAAGLWAIGLGMGYSAIIGLPLPLPGGGSRGWEVIVTTDPFDIAIFEYNTSLGSTSVGLLVGLGAYAKVCSGSGAYEEGTGRSTDVAIGWFTGGATCSPNYRCGYLGVGKGPAGLATQESQSRLLFSARRDIPRALRELRRQMGRRYVYQATSDFAGPVVWTTQWLLRRAVGL